MKIQLQTGFYSIKMKVKKIYKNYIKKVLKEEHFIQNDFGEEIVVFNKTGNKSFEDFIKKIDEYLGDELGILFKDSPYIIYKQFFINIVKILKRRLIELFFFFISPK